MVGFFQIARHAVGVDAQAEEKGVGVDIAVEAELVIQHMPAAGPAVFDLFGDAQLGGLERVLGQLVENRSVDGGGMLAVDGKPAE